VAQTLFDHFLHGGVVVDGVMGGLLEQLRIEPEAGWSFEFHGWDLPPLRFTEKED
jgi:hypothetical protein